GQGVLGRLDPGVAEGARGHAGHRAPEEGEGPPGPSRPQELPAAERDRALRQQPEVVPSGGDALREAGDPLPRHGDARHYLPPPVARFTRHDLVLPDPGFGVIAPFLSLEATRNWTAAIVGACHGPPAEGAKKSSALPLGVKIPPNASG